MKTMVLRWQKFSTFCHHLWAASSGVVLLALFNNAVGKDRRSWTPTFLVLLSLGSFFYLFTAGLLLFPLLVLELSAWRGDFHIAVGGGSWTPNSPMLSSNSFLLAAGPSLVCAGVTGALFSNWVIVWGDHVLYSWALPCPCCCTWCWLVYVWKVATLQVRITKLFITPAVKV